MSRLGKLPIELVAGVSAEVKDKTLTVKGPKGQLQQTLLDVVQIAIIDNGISVAVKDKDDRGQRALWGLYWSLVKNMVLGVTVGFSKKLEINGVGYKVSGGGDKINLALGFSHPVVFPMPSGITAKVEANTITISGIDKQAVGEVAAQIRHLKEPEPYKGKGIKYADEVVRRKAGKTATK